MSIKLASIRAMSRISHLRGWLRVLFVFITLGHCHLSASAEDITAQPPSNISAQDMDRIVKAARDAVLQELGKDHQSAAVTQAPAEQLLEGEVSELIKSGSLVFYQRLGDALRAMPQLGKTMGSLVGFLAQRTAGGWSLSAFLAILLTTVIGGSVVSWLTRLGMCRWFNVGAQPQLVDPMPLTQIAVLAVSRLAGWSVFWLVCDLVTNYCFSGVDIKSMVGTWFLWAAARIFLYLTLFEIWFRPKLKPARIVPLDDEDARRAKEFFIVIAAVIVFRTWILTVHTFGVTGSTLAAGLILNNLLFVGSFFWAAYRGQTAIAHWIMNTQSSTGKASKLRQFVANHWIALAGTLVLLLAFGHLIGAVSGRAEVATGLTITLRIILFTIFLFSLTSFCTRRLASQDTAAPGERTTPRVSTSVGRMILILIALSALYWLAWLWFVPSLGVIAADDWQAGSAHLLRPMIVIVAGYVAWIGFSIATNRYLAFHSADFGDSTDQSSVSSRLATLIPILRLAVAIGLAVIVSFVALSGLGVNITPLLAGASVVGLAISFGSQALVKDVVSGLFYIADDSFRVGEYINCGNVKGTVEGFTLRSVRLRHQSGQLHTVPFGQLNEITNFSRDWTSVKFTLNLDRGVDLDRVRIVTKKVGDNLMQDPEFASQLLEPLRFQGIVNITDVAIVAGFKFVTKPTSPSAIEREAKRRLLYRFREENIKLASQIFVTSAGEMSGA